MAPCRSTKVFNHKGVFFRPCLGDGHGLLYHCRRQSLLAVGGHVSVSRDPSHGDTRPAPATLVGLHCLYRGAVAMCLIVAFDVHTEFRIILASHTASAAARSAASAFRLFGCNTLCFCSLPRLPVVGVIFGDPLSSCGLCSQGQRVPLRSLSSWSLCCSSVDVTVCEEKVLSCAWGSCAHTLPFRDLPPRLLQLSAPLVGGSDWMLVVVFPQSHHRAASSSSW